VIKGINFFPEQLRGILLGIEGLTGAYKVEATKKNNIIDRLNLICEIKSTTSSSNLELKNLIEKSIRDDLTISCDVNFVYEIPLRGNKSRLLEIFEE